MSRPDRGGPLSTLVGHLRGSLWPIPCIGIVLAIVLGVLMPHLDELLDRDGQNALTFVFGGGPAAARDLLAAISGSLISVTGLTFSLTVVSLQLGSSQYSPRLLQTFVTDRTVQVTLAQLVLTFVYALTVLRTVRTEGATAGDQAFVPRLSITVAYLLTLGSVLGLVLFLAHLAQILRVETMLRDVHQESLGTFSRELAEPDTEVEELVGARSLPAGAPQVLTAPSSGFLVGITEDALVDAALECDAVVLLDVRLGDSVVFGTPVAHAWARGDEGLDLEALTRALHRGLKLGFERTPDRDVGYSLRKVVDIAARALSPGVNDPTTAVHALSHVASMLGGLLARPLPPRLLSDEDGELRVVVPSWTAEALLRLGLEETLVYAEGQPPVLRRVAEMLREIAWVARPECRPDLRDWFDRLIEVTGESTRVSSTELTEWRERFEDATEGRWSPTRPPMLG